MEKNLINNVSEIIKMREQELKDSIEDVPYTEVELKDFKNNLYQYEEIDKLIIILNKQIEPYKHQVKPLNEQLKLLKKEKKNIEESLHKFMQRNKIAICNMPTRKPGDSKGAITLATTTTKQSMTENYVHQTLHKFFANQPDNFNTMSSSQKAETIYEYIYKKDRPKVVKPVIKKVAYTESVNNVEHVIEDDEE
jgi:Family of unknown function (DUF5760)